MHTYSQTHSSGPDGHARSVSSTLTAFACAVAGAAITSRLIFDHQTPSQPEDVVTYIATLGATVIAGWWLSNVLAWAVALHRGVQLDRFTLPGTKRIAQVILAATLSTSCVAEASGDPVMVLVEQADDSIATTAPNPTTTTAPGIPSTTAKSTSTLPSSTPPTTEETIEIAAAQEPVAEVAPIEQQPVGIQSHQVVVNDGDNLWSLTAEALTAHGVEAPTTPHIAEYWRLVVAANQVRSGNPDLIVAGEAITMPAFELPTSASPSQTPLSSPSEGIGVR